MKRVIGQFADEGDLISAVRELQSLGISDLNAVTPRYIPLLSDLIVPKDRKIQIWAVVGAALGGIGGYFLEFYAAAVSYPIDVGGRPLNSVPAFLQVTFEMTVLGSTFATIAALFFLLRLPKLHQPVFEIKNIGRASKDRYFLLAAAPLAEQTVLNEIFLRNNACEVSLYED